MRAQLCMGLNRYQRRNRLQTIAVVALLVGQAIALGWVAAGAVGAGAVAIIVALSVRSISRMSPHWMLRKLKAEPLKGSSTLKIRQTFAGLVDQAKLNSSPGLFSFDHDIPTAFAAGSDSKPVVVVSTAMLKEMDHRQLTGVLAHELAHVRHRDLEISGLMAVLSGVHRQLGRLGVAVVAFGGFTQSPGTVIAGLVLTLGPGMANLLTRALSRQREYDADFGAADLTGDPLGLASALARLQSSGHWERLGPRHDPSPLDSHPETEERIRRLRALVTTSASSFS